MLYFFKCSMVVPQKTFLICDFKSTVSNLLTTRYSLLWCCISLLRVVLGTLKSLCCTFSNVFHLKLGKLQEILVKLILHWIQVALSNPHATCEFLTKSVWVAAPETLPQIIQSQINEILVTKRLNC